jgi:hypothetical protein
MIGSCHIVQRNTAVTGGVNRRRFLRTLAASMAALALPADCLAGGRQDGKKGGVLERKSKPTLTPFGLNHNETLRFLLRDGRAWEMTLVKTSAEVIQRNRGISAYAFDCDLLINGKDRHLRREVGTQASFYEPWEIDGVCLWFDAASCAFKEAGGFMAEKDWLGGLVCQPAHNGRFAVQESGLPICPEPLKPWYPNDTGRIDIRDCYNGEDCWMGPYGGTAAHCGLDINMKAGTVLSAPIALDDHCLFNATAAGFNNNRWRGVRRWPDGSEWSLQSHHLIRMLVPERTPLKAAAPYATTAGVRVGSHEHTHFVFRVLGQGGDYLLDPWILFWETFRQQREAGQGESRTGSPPTR